MSAYVDFAHLEHTTLPIQILKYCWSMHLVCILLENRSMHLVCTECAGTMSAQSVSKICLKYAFVSTDWWKVCTNLLLSARKVCLKYAFVSTDWWKVCTNLLLSAHCARCTLCRLGADLVQAVARAGLRVSDRRSGGAGGRTGGRAAVNSLATVTIAAGIP